MQDNIEFAIDRVAADQDHRGACFGLELSAGATAVEFLLSPGTGYDRTGRRVTVDTVQTIDVSQDSVGNALPTAPDYGIPVSIYLTGRVVESNPELDGNDITVNTTISDNFTIGVVYGTPGDFDTITGPNGPATVVVPNPDNGEPYVLGAIPASAILLGVGVITVELGIPSFRGFTIDRDSIAELDAIEQIDTGSGPEPVAFIDKFSSYTQAVRFLYRRMVKNTTDVTTLYSSLPTTPSAGLAFPHEDTVGSLAPGASVDFIVPLTDVVLSGQQEQYNNLFTVQCLLVTNDAGAVGGTVELFFDSARTVPAYDADLLDRNGVPTNLFKDTTPWMPVRAQGNAAIKLLGPAVDTVPGIGNVRALYGRITNGDTSVTANYTYTVIVLPLYDTFYGATL